MSEEVERVWAVGARACSDAECGLCGPLDSGSALPWERHSVRERGKEGKTEKGKSWGGGERAYFEPTPSLPNLHSADHLRHGVSSEREGGKEKGKGEAKGRKQSV